MLAHKPLLDGFSPGGEAKEGAEEWADPIDQATRCMLKLGIIVVPAAIQLPWHHPPNRTTAHLLQG